VDEELSRPAFRSAVSLPVVLGNGHERIDPIRDLDHIRQFVASPGPAALFDLPWTPLHLLICFLFHPWLGWLTAAGALTVSALAIWGSTQPRPGGAKRADCCSAPKCGRRWAPECRSAATMNLAARRSSASDLHQRVSRSFRREVTARQALALLCVPYLLHPLVLVLAAYLAIRQEIAGTIISFDPCFAHARTSRCRGGATATVCRRPPGNNAQARARGK
jgi:ATP-binding cassette subfamily C protein